MTFRTKLKTKVIIKLYNPNVYGVTKGFVTKVLLYIKCNGPKIFSLDTFFY